MHNKAMQSSSALISAAAILLCFQTAAVPQRACGAQAFPSVPLQRPFVEAAETALTTFSSADFVKKPDGKASEALIQQFALQARQLDEGAGSLRDALVNYGYARVRNAALLLHARHAVATIPLSFKKNRYLTSVFFGGDAPLRALIQSVDDREEACRLTIADGLKAGQIQSDFQECELASVDPRSDPLPIPARPGAAQSSAAVNGSGRFNPVFAQRAQVALQSIEDLQTAFLGSFGMEGVPGELLSESRIDLATAFARGGPERSVGHGLDELFHLRSVQLETQIVAERRLLAQLMQKPSGATNNDKLLAEVSQRLPQEHQYALASARYQGCRDQILEALRTNQKLTQSESCSAGTR